MLSPVCARFLRCCAVASVGVVVLVGPAGAQAADPRGSLVELPIPGGVAAAMQIVGDPGTPDRSQFLLDFIRRFHDTPILPKTDRRAPIVRALVSHLQVGARGDQQAGAPETIPLPLSPAIWNDVVFRQRPPSESLLASIVQTRHAALMYHGLMSLDDPSRAWLAARPDVLGEVAARYAAAFNAAAPGLRVAHGGMRLPGGDAAVPAWEALVGRRVTQPEAFVRALVSHGEGRLAVFLGTMAQLAPADGGQTPAGIRAALKLDSPAPDDRLDAARRLHAIFERLAPGWKIEDRTFWRPLIDPAMLVAELPTDTGGRLVLPGTARFWTAVFGDAEHARRQTKTDEDARALAEGDPVDLLWLCEQVFSGDHSEQRRRYQLVLFASRILAASGGLAAATARDALEAVRAAATYPALTAVLERAKLADVRAYAAAARRAAGLSRIEDGERAVRALAQFQGSVALLARAGVRGSVTPGTLAGLVSSLSAVDPSAAGDYEGRLVRWVTTHLSPEAAGGSSEPAPSEGIPAGAVEANMLRLLAGPPPMDSPPVEWEGTRYRVDPAWAEARRLLRLLGEQPRPYLSSAVTVIGIADALAQSGLPGDELRRQLDVLERLAPEVGWDGSGNWRTDVTARYRDLSEDLRRAARNAEGRAGSRLSAPLRILADDLLARGLQELAYAVALGHEERAVISAGEAASRHDYGLDAAGVRRAAAPWRLPLAGATMHGWRVTGSLLGLDVRLADFALLRLSSRPPPRKPTLNDEDRRVFTEAAVLVEPSSLRAAEHDAIVAALRKGRERLAAVRTAADAAAIADEIRLAPLRRTLLSWVVAHDSGRLTTFLSPAELFWLGLDKAPVSAAFHAWGAPAEPRLGCLCLRMLDRRPWEEFAGRWNAGLLASGFADLNLRLAELLAELRMPAPLLAPVLAAATLELINDATSRDQDDRRGLVEFVQALRAERLEQYLALLTTDGPLVPIEAVSSSFEGRGAAEANATGVPR